MEATKPDYKPPYVVPLSGFNALVRELYNGDANMINLYPQAAYEKDVVKVRRNRDLLINNPDLIKKLFANDEKVFFRSPDQLGYLSFHKDLFGDSFFTNHGPKWKQDKEALIDAFKLLRPATAFPIVNNVVQNHLPKDASAGGRFPLEFSMSWLAADITYNNLFSKPLNFYDVQKISGNWEYLKKVSFMLAADQGIDEKYVGELPTDFDLKIKEIRNHVAREMQNHTGDHNISYHVSQHFSGKDLIDQLVAFLLSSYESMASTLTWSIYILTQQPQYVDLIRKEIDPVMEKGITENDLKKLVYTRAFIQEVLRLYPVNLMVPRLTNEDIDFEGIKIRKGVRVLVSPWVLHRHRKYWDDPDVFKPERFLPENKNNIQPGTYLPFGMGPHSCAGSHYAMMAILIAISYFVHHFNFKCNEQNVQPVNRLMTVPKNEIEVEAICRI